MERVAVLFDGEQVDAAALRLPRAPRIAAGTPRAGESVNEQMSSLERARIEETLRAEGWNISRAAARLGLPRNTPATAWSGTGSWKAGRLRAVAVPTRPPFEPARKRLRRRWLRLHRRCDGSERASRCSRRRCSMPIRRPLSTRAHA
jgi:hypothetical protein